MTEQTPAVSDAYATEDIGEKVLTACGLIGKGPKVRALLNAANAAGDKKWAAQVLSFVEVWHRLEWNEMREPEVTP